MNRLNLLSKLNRLVVIEGKEFIIKEKSAYKFFTALEFLSENNLLGFFVNTAGIEVFKHLVRQEDVNKVIDEIMALHIVKEECVQEEDLKKEDAYKLFFQNTLTLLLYFSSLWHSDPVYIARRYTLRQLQELYKIINRSGKKNYKEYIDEYGRKVVSFEE